MLGSLASELTGWDLTVVAPADTGSTAHDRTSRFKVLRAQGWGNGPRGRRFSAGIAVRSLQAAVAQRPDVLLCGHPSLTPVALLLHRLLRIPFVVFTYDVEFRQPRLRRWLPRVFRSAAGVLTISQFNREVVEGLGCPPESVRPLPVGFDPRRFASVQPSGLVDELGLTGRPWLLTVCRLDDRYKGVDTMIRALPEISRAVPDVRYVVAGDGKYRTDLEKLALDLGCSDRITFTGRVSEADLAALYSGCTAFALMSRDNPEDGGAEGFGLVFLEANSFGKPVLGGRSGGIPDAVIDDETGLLADPADPGEVARNAILLLQDRDLALRLGTRGRERVMSELTWSNSAACLRRIVEGAVGVTGAPR